MGEEHHLCATGIRSGSSPATHCLSRGREPWTILIQITIFFRSDLLLLLIPVFPLFTMDSIFKLFFSFKNKKQALRKLSLVPRKENRGSADDSFRIEHEGPCIIQLFFFLQKPFSRLKFFDLSSISTSGDGE